MKVRWVPPVFSPVSVPAIVSGAGAALGVLPADYEAVRARINATFGARATVLTDRGTSALVLALRALVPPGGAVAMPAYACVDLIAAAIAARVMVRLYDVDPATLSPDLDSVRAAISRGVGALVAAPLYGYPMDMPGLSAIAASGGVPVIEDAAQGAGGVLDGRRIGSFGGLSILSFGRGKGMTCGAGGALLVHDPALESWAVAAEARMPLPRRGWGGVVALAAQWALARPALYGAPASIPALHLGEMVYHAATEPRLLALGNVRMLEWALAADRMSVEHRRARAAELLAALASSGRYQPVRALAGATPGYLRVALVQTAGIAEPAPRLGVLRGYPQTLDEHPHAAAVMAAGERAGAGARQLSAALLTAAVHSRCSPADMSRARTWLARSARSAGAPGSAPESS